MTRMRIAAVAAGFLLSTAVLLSGCSAGGSESGATSSDAAAPRQGDAATDGRAQGEGRSEGEGTGPQKDSGAGGGSQPTVTRAIIKTGSLMVETDKVDESRTRAMAVVTALQGQVASEDTGSNADGRIDRVDLVVKVPTASYETAIQRLSELGRRTAIHQESKDVTEQVVDVNSRIASQRASLERMRALLAKATEISEIVSVENELTKREADLESLLAKQKTLSSQTELATLNLLLTEKGKAPVEEDDTGFLAGLESGWKAFGATFAALATVLGALLPFLIAAALIGVPLWRFRSKFRRPAVPVAATAPAGPLPQHPDRPDQR